MFDLVHKALSQCPFTITPDVVLARGLAILAGRNDLDCIMSKDKLDKRLPIVSAIGQHIVADLFTNKTSARAMSWRSPPVKLKRNGLPNASTLAWFWC